VKSTIEWKNQPIEYANKLAISFGFSERVVVFVTSLRNITDNK